MDRRSYLGTLGTPVVRRLGGGSSNAPLPGSDRQSDVPSENRPLPARTFVEGPKPVRK